MTKSIITSWKTHREHTVAQHILYNAYRGKPLTLGFTAIFDKNTDKIRSSCNDKWNGFNQALSYLQRLFKPTSSDWVKQRNAETISNIETVLGVELTDAVKSAILEHKEL